MPRVIHFEINADQPQRAVDFYKKVFGWKVEKWDGPQDYWLITTGDNKEPGINGGLMKRMNPGAATYNTVDVSSVDEFAASVVKHGGKITMPKAAIPEVGWFAYCQDTEGNVFGIMQNDPSAN
jgi:predicted enzyme related to lactoylglutathione lyase